MAADVFGRRLDDDIDAMFERLEERGVAQVLSMTTIAPAALASAEILATSSISNVSEPGDSKMTTLVSGLMRPVMLSKGSK